VNNVVPTSVYTDESKAIVAAACDAYAAEWNAQAAIEAAWMSTGTDHYTHCAGMRDAFLAISTNLRS